MSESTPTRRQYLLLEAVDPDCGKATHVQISYQRLHATAARSMGQTVEAAYLVPEALQKPTAIFEGLRRNEDEDPGGAGWRCYCCVPTCSYRTDGTQAPPYPGQVFLVFVNSERVACNWYWVRADTDQPDLPMDHETRFKKRRL